MEPQEGWQRCYMACISRIGAKALAKTEEGAVHGNMPSKKGLRFGFSEFSLVAKCFLHNFGVLESDNVIDMLSIIIFFFFAIFSFFFFFALFYVF